MGDEQMEHEHDPPTINLNTNSSSEWTTLLPQILHKRHLKCIHQTATSAKHLFPNGNYYSYGYTSSYHHSTLNPKHDINDVDVDMDGEKNFIPPELESTLFEAFFDNDYDGALHLTTIHEVDNDSDTLGDHQSSYEKTSCTNTNSHNHSNHDQITNSQHHNMRDVNTPVGIIFWREMPDDEMVEWLDFDNLIKALHRHANTLSLHHDDHHYDNDECNPKARRSLHMVRQNSIHSLTNISTSDTNNTSSLNNDLEEAVAYAITTTENKKSTSNHTSRTIDDSIIQKDVVTHAWVKIELLSVRKRGQKIGTLLLACALYHAYLYTNHQHQSRAILHVAGGSSNVPAVKLYKRFGFLPVPIKSGIFHTPNKDLYILGNIGQSLAALAWEETF